VKILVTGASGFIGQNLVPRLIQLGHDVRTFGRASAAPQALAKLGVEHARGDVTNPEQVAAAVKDCEMVFHLAGLVSYRKKDQARQYAVNVLGTRHVMQACLREKVGRVVHTSSVAAFGLPRKGEIGNEEIEYNLKGLGLAYCDTKHEGEQEVMKFYSNGLNVIILNPGIIFGEGDTHPHHHAIFAAMSKGSLIGVPPGGVTFSDIHDVVDAYISCLSKGRFGQRYSIVSSNLSFKEAASIFAKLNGARAPLFKIPGAVLVGLGTFAEDVLPAFGVNPPLTRQAAWLSQHDIFFGSEKACAELDFHQTPFEETVRRTAPYYLGKTLATSN
jgi:dihydroflavonol-4-reductase